jgi:hypothetical protein
MVQLLLILAVLSLWWALRGHGWSLALPAVLTLFGAVLYLAGEPTPPGGGDGDPMRLTGTGLLIFCGPWLALALVFYACRLWFRRRSDETQEQR